VSKERAVEHFRNVGLLTCLQSRPTRGQCLPQHRGKEAASCGSGMRAKTPLKKMSFKTMPSDVPGRRYRAKRQGGTCSGSSQGQQAQKPSPCHEIQGDLQWMS